MQKTNAQTQWEEYRERELKEVTFLLAKLGFALEDEQQHISGERYLMSGYKLVLVGRRISDQKRVIIKVSGSPSGAAEIEQEHGARTTMQKLRFAYYLFPSPEELLYISLDGYQISITAYLGQEKNFLARSLEEQFLLALKAFKTQEGVHATAHSHTQVIKRIFGIWSAQEYLASYMQLQKNILALDPGNQALEQTLAKAAGSLAEHREIIEQYCGFLTHSDFVPHNLRVIGGEMYLLDQTSLRFGNKYESWARFCNFMMLHNRPLEEALVRYVEDNRTPEESVCLRLMRMYKLVELLAYYANTLSKTEGDLHTLSVIRIEFWRKALESLLAAEPLGQDIVTHYQHERDQLRSEEEKKRQEQLH